MPLARIRRLPRRAPKFHLIWTGLTVRNADTGELAIEANGSDMVALVMRGLDRTAPDMLLEQKKD